MAALKIALHAVSVVFLTVLSQLGGLAYLIALFTPQLSRRWRAATFLGAYAGLWLAAMFVAPVFGRVPLARGASSSPNLKMQSVLYCGLNRHYVTPRLKAVASNLADYVNAEHPGTVTLALDGNFPFLDGFALLPHLSHDDGKKLDLAFFYARDGQTRSPIGYWAFEDPQPSDHQPCKDAIGATLRWDMEGFAIFNSALDMDEARTRTALNWLAREGRKQGVSKVFVEPHLAHRLNVSGDVIRFQGCHAARHDDHIHFQID